MGFNGGSAIDGLFDMKVNYKFIQKFMFLADRPQEGSFVLYRKMEGGMWKTKVTVDNNNMMPKPFLDISVESDRKTKLHVLFNFQEDNKWELKVVGNNPWIGDYKLSRQGEFEPVSPSVY